MAYFPEEKIRYVFSHEYGEVPLSIRRIEEGVDNANYVVSASSGTEYLFKICYKRTKLDIQFEIELLKHLEKIQFPCHRIIPTKKGVLYSFFGKKPAVLFRYIQGVLGDQMPNGGLYIVGTQLATIHSIDCDFPLRSKKEAWMWEPQNVSRYVASKSRHIIEKGYPGARNFIFFVSKALGALPDFRGLPSGITHQDVKQENVIIDRRGTIHFIDFDLAYPGILLIDLATPVIWFCFTDSGEFLSEKARELLRGYSEVRHLETEEKKLFYDALRFRLLRESFVGPMKYTPDLATRKRTGRFLNAYKAVMQTETKKRIEEIVSSLS